MSVRSSGRTWSRSICPPPPTPVPGLEARGRFGRSLSSPRRGLPRRQSPLPRPPPRPASRGCARRTTAAPSSGAVSRIRMRAARAAPAPPPAWRGSGQDERLSCSRRAHGWPRRSAAAPRLRERARAVGVLELRRERIRIMNRDRREPEPGDDGFGQCFRRLLRFLDDLGDVEELLERGVAQGKERAAQGRPLRCRGHLPSLWSARPGPRCGIAAGSSLPRAAGPGARSHSRSASPRCSAPRSTPASSRSGEPVRACRGASSRPVRLQEPPARGWRHPSRSTPARRFRASSIRTAPRPRCREWSPRPLPLYA